MIPGLGRSPGEGNGNPLQYSCLENPTDGGAWWATVHGVTKSRTSPAYLSRVIREQTGKNFNAIIAQIQVEHAVRLMDGGA